MPSMTMLIALMFIAGIAMLVLSFLLKIARKLLRLLGGALCILALIAAVFLMFVLIPAMG